MTETSINRRYKILIEGRDVGFGFLTSFELVVADRADIEPFFRSLAKEEGWTFVSVEQTEDLGVSSEPVNHMVQLTGRAYFELD